MKQEKGRDYKSTRQWTDEERKAKKRLRENIKKSEIKGEFDEEKLATQKREENEWKKWKSQWY